MAGRGEVIWSRRLRPAWRGAYPLLFALVAVVGLWIGVTEGRDDPYGSAADEQPFSVPLFAGIGAVGAFAWTLGAWLPRASLTADGTLAYRALVRRRSIDLGAVDHVTLTTSPVILGGRSGKRPGRHVLEVRPPTARDAVHQQSISAYLAPEGVVGVASPPLEWAEQEELVLYLNQFTAVERDLD